MAQGDGSQDFHIGPRAARPDRRVDVLLLLATTFVAVVVYVVALALDLHPPIGLTVAFFATAPVCATFALVLLEILARSEQDARLGWVSAGLAVGIVAMVLQILSFPVVSSTGGPLSTSDEGSAALYLLFHLALAAGAVAGVFRVAPLWRVPAVLAGWLVALLLAVDAVPLPDLLRAGRVYTTTLVWIEWILAALTLGAVVLWIERVGRSPDLVNAWVAVALSLSVYDLALNALGAERYTAVWWGSLSLRVATYLVLAFGPLTAVLARLRDVEQYGERELERRETELRSWLTVTAGLLSSAEELSRAVTSRQVADALATQAQAVSGASYASVVSAVPGEPLRLLGAAGYDEQQRRRLRTADWDEQLPHAIVVRSEQAVFLETQRAIWQRFPRVVTLPMADAGALAALPITVGEQTLGVLTVWDRTPRRWSGEQRRVLSGLAAQGGQAIARARAYEEQAAAARTLQKALLPSDLPQPRRLDLAARYLPAEHGLLVGGDWYDCLVVDDDRLALVVGDVMGKGLHAAALMGRIRMAVRSVAALDPSPAAVLRALDDLNVELGPDGIVTLVYVLVDQATGTARVARAGHLPPALVTADGDVRLVTEGGSAPLGAPPGERGETEVTLGTGTLLVLFTDGLVEDRETGVGPGLARLTRALHELAPDVCATGELATRLIRSCRAEGSEDDIALLVARYAGTGGAPTVPAQATRREPGPAPAVEGPAPVVEERTQ